MKALNFVIGMIVGMVLLVVAVVGAIFAAGTLVSVGQLESTLGTDIFDDESSVNEMTILDLVQKIIDDAQNPDTLTINKLITDYGIRIPGEVSGIDISVLFDYPVTEVPDHLGDVVNSMTLRDVGEFLDMDFESEYPELAILQDNLDNNVNVALDNILSSIDDETMTIYSIERSFGLSLGSNNLIETLYHTPLSSFAAVMDNLPVGIVADADSDLFVPDGETELFVLTDVYEEVPADELLSSEAAAGAETYIAGADDNGLIYRELRFVLDDDGSYIPDNSCYASSFDAEANDKTFYRHIIYSPFDPAADYDETAVLAVPTRLNNFVSDGEGGFALADGGMTELTTVFVSADMSVSLSEAILSGAVPADSGTFDFSSMAVYVPSADGGAELAAEFGLADGVTPDGNTRLDDNYTGWLRIHTGTADPAMQIIAGETLKTVSGATDKITSLKLGEVIDITDDSAKILQTLADTPINKMSDALDTLTLSDATDIVMSEYTPSADGAYVLTADGYYTLYNPSDASHVGLQRYDKTSVEGESSQALQRLANVTIPNISSAFSDIVLGDVLNVETDSFRVAEDPVNGEVYYVFNDLGYPERVVYDENTPAGGTLYERVSEGGGNAVLKQLAYVKIDNISAAMDGIIENTLLSDIIDIAEYTSAKVSEGTGSWLFAYNPDFTVGEGAEAEYYTFVYDGSGKYYMTDTLYHEAEDGQLVQTGTAYWTYESNAAYSFVDEILTARDGGRNIWFLEDGEYVQNPALVAYCAAQAAAGSSGEALAVLQSSFSRVQATQETPGASSSPVYANAEGAAAAAGGLYVRSEGITGFGGYEPYDPDDITHHGVQLYFRYSGGYYPASSERLADDGVTKYSFDFTEGYVPYTGSGTAYVTLPAVTEGSGDSARTVYYYTLIDSGYEEGYVTYSMRECEYIFLRAADGEYAKVNGEYVLYDADVHGTDADRYDRVIGYIGNDAANDGGTGLTPLSSVEVDVLEEKSPVILTSLLARQITIGSMSDVIDTLTVEELMEIEPGSVFDSEELRTATIDDISSRITAMFTSMTVGQLLEYANVSVSAEIAYILSDVHITDFFGALTFNPDTAAIEVDMYKLFGVGA